MEKPLANDLYGSGSSELGRDEAPATNGNVPILARPVARSWQVPSRPLDFAIGGVFVIVVATLPDGQVVAVLPITSCRIG